MLDFKYEMDPEYPFFFRQPHGGLTRFFRTEGSRDEMLASYLDAATPATAAATLIGRVSHRVVHEGAFPKVIPVGQQEPKIPGMEVAILQEERGKYGS